MSSLFNTPQTLDINIITDLLPHRPEDGHKGIFGNLCIVGGDDGMQGALIIAARSALHTGTGRVYAVSLANEAVTLDIHSPEIMFRSLSPAQAWLNLSNDIIIGPGLGQTSKAKDVLAVCLQQEKSLLLDADALNLIAQNPRMAELLKKRTHPTVLTPHPAEAARLLETSVENIQQHRVDCALEIARQFNTICVLKGAGTLIASPDDQLFFNPTGNVGLAIAGSGDLLSGMIGSFIAQGMALTDAAKLGVYIHGSAADTLLSQGTGPIGLSTEEILISARNLLNRLYNKRYGKKDHQLNFIV
jgi:ADP-dependent NAD(P)H-hydrate dehydratase / NAD(P)H-hydrate epimerase